MKPLIYQRKGYTPPVHKEPETQSTGSSFLKNLTMKRSRSKEHLKGSHTSSSEAKHSTQSRTPQQEIDWLCSEKVALQKELDIVKGQLQKSENEKNEEINKRVTIAGEKVVITKQVEELEERLNSVTKEKGRQEGQANSLRRSQQAHQNYQLELTNAMADLSKTKKDLEVLQTERDEQKRKNLILQKSLREKDLENKELIIKIEQLSQTKPDLSKYNQNVTNLSSSITKLEESNGKLRAERNHFSESLQNLQKKGDEKIVQMKKEIDELRKISSELEVRNQILKEENKMVHEQIEEVCIEVIEKNDEIEKLQKEKKDLEELHLFEEHQLEILSQHCDQVEADVKMLDGVVGEKKNEIELFGRHLEVLVMKLRELDFGVDEREDGELVIFKIEPGDM